MYPTFYSYPLTSNLCHDSTMPTTNVRQFIVAVYSIVFPLHYVNPSEVYIGLTPSGAEALYMLKNSPSTP